MKRNRLMAQWGRLCRAQWDVLSHTLYINHGLCVLWMTLSVKWKGKARAAFRLEFTYTHTHTTEARHTLRNHTRTCRHQHALHTHIHTHIKCLQQQQVHSTLLLPLRSTQPFTLNQLFIQICFWQSSHTTWHFSCTYTTKQESFSFCFSLTIARTYGVWLMGLSAASNACW